MTIRRAVLSGPDAPGRVLPWLVAVHLCVATLATAAAARVYDAAEAQRRILEAGLTIHLPASDEPETDAARLQAVLSRVRDEPAVKAATPLPEARLRALLAPWLDSQDVLRDVRLPTLVDVTLHSGAEVDPAALAARLATVHPGVVVDTHAPAGDGMTAPWCLAVGAAAALDLLLIALTAAAGSAAVRGALALRRDATELLHRLGADDRRIAAPLLGRTIRRILFGASLGLSAAAAAVYGLPHVLGDRPIALVAGWSDIVGLSPGAFAVVAAVPMVLVFVAILAARVTALRALAGDG